MKFYMDKLGRVAYVHMKFQVSRLSVRPFLCCKMLSKSHFLNFSERGSYRKCGIDVIFYIDILLLVGRIHTKFQVSRLSGSLLVYCKIL